MNTEKQQRTTIGQEFGENEALVESGLSEAEIAQLAAEVIANLRNGLEKSEEKAVDVTSAVEQVVILSDRDQYWKAMDAIFNDPSLSTEQRIRLKAEVDARQDTKVEQAIRRVKELQSSQTLSIIETVKAYGGMICLGIGGVSVLLLCGTTTGRGILNKAVTWVIKEGPRLVQQTVV